jgi:predicted TIM-barrel fold metal-dependent hydrolase
MSTEDHYVVISADGHCGADIGDYREYLAPRFHDEFDAWAGEFSEPWAELDKEMPAGQRRLGRFSFADPLNWQSAERQEYLESEGIVAEVLFPNTAPPFYPSAAITAPGPRNAEEYARRFAGIQAHNRWLADFCSEAPGRRAGMAQVFLNDVDDAVREVRWARDHGLMGVLLPADHLLALVNLYYPALDPFWAVCEELEMPVHRHGIVVAESTDVAGQGANAIGSFESAHYITRGVAHLILSGVFERFPRLKFVVSEFQAFWATGYLDKLDVLGRESAVSGTHASLFCRSAFEQLSLTPSEYARRNMYYGSFLTTDDIEARDRLGADRIMWASDFPHHEGSYPFSRAALRLLFAGLPEDDVRRMTSLNAAECYGFDLAVLQPVADRVGPTVGELATPITADERPQVPEESMCVTFGGIRPMALAKAEITAGTSA